VAGWFHALSNVGLPRAIVNCGKVRQRSALEQAATLSRFRDFAYR
jgi:hypothetical protein